MDNSTLKNLYLKNKLLLFTLFISFSLFVTENVFAITRQFKPEFIQAKWDGVSVDITALVYNYSVSNVGYLEHCTFEGWDGGSKYYKLMEIETKRQSKAEFTRIILLNKLTNAKIALIDFRNYNQPFWPEQYKGYLSNLQVYTYEDKAIAHFGWAPSKDHSNVQLLRISGKWHLNGTTAVEDFVYVVKLKKNYQPKKMQQTEVKEINNVEVYGESNAIVVKGAENGANIMILNTTTGETKSFISNNYVVKINLPANQIYLVTVGTSSYKVSL